MKRENIKNQVILYLEENTDLSNIWCSILVITKFILNQGLDTTEALLVLQELFDGGIIFITYDEYQIPKIALVENINKAKNVYKKEAIADYKKMLEECEEREDYPGAIKIRDRIKSIE